MAAFDPTDVTRIEATTGFQHDDNLFRLPDIVDAKTFGIERRSDTIRILGLGLTFDKMISRQRLFAELNVNDTKYDKNSKLDYTGGDGRASWFWQAGNLWNGEASYRRRRQLGGFEDFRVPVQDIIEVGAYTLAGGYQFHPRWRASAEVTQQDVSHKVREDLNHTTDTIGASLRYRTPSENSIGIDMRRTDRRYPNRLADTLLVADKGHRETRLIAAALWQLTGTLKLDAALGHTEVKHDVQSQRDFSGITGRAGAVWDATGKLRVNLSAFRDLRLYEDTSTSYQVVDGIAVSPAYAITSKIALRCDLTLEKRDYRGEPLRDLGIDIQREDNVRLERIGIAYSPIRNVDLSLSYESGDRRSRWALPNAAINDYDYQAWFGTIRVGF